LDVVRVAAGNRVVRGGLQIRLRVGLVLKRLVEDFVCSRLVRAETLCHTHGRAGSFRRRLRVLVRRSTAAARSTPPRTFTSFTCFDLLSHVCRNGLCRLERALGAIGRDLSTLSPTAICASHLGPLLAAELLVAWIVREHGRLRHRAHISAFLRS